MQAATKVGRLNEERWVGSLEEFVSGLKSQGFEGERDGSPATLDFYSHDASLFELRPKLVVFPKNMADLSRLVAVVNQLRPTTPDLNITARSAGTCMSGGSIGESIVIDFTKHMNKLNHIEDFSAQVEPGMFYRDFEKETLRFGSLLPTFPASRELAALGGMIGNSAGGEKSLEYGKTIDYVKQLDVILSNGRSYKLKPLNRQELEKKKGQQDFEGEIYRKMHKLLEDNYELIKDAKPKVSKNSTGYNLWDVWDRQTGIFDLSKLFVGSQGTLGLVGDIHLRLIKDKPHSGVLVVFMKDTKVLGEIINEVKKYKPASFEAFDNYTLMLSIKFFPYFRKT